MATFSRTLESSLEALQDVSDDMCQACGGSATEPIWSIRIRRRSLLNYLRTAGIEPHPIQLVRCESCRSVYQSPMLASSVYTGWYRDPRYDFCRGSAYSDVASEAARHATTMVKILSRLTGLGCPRVLDVGCGSGVFMGVCAREGWTVVGCDPSLHRVQRHDRSLPIVVSTFENADFGSSQFDLITFWDVFEHFGDPRRVLHKVRTLLHDDGFLAIEVPNVSSWYSRVLGRRWWYDFEHLFYYSPSGLSLLLAECGFHTVAVESDNFNLFTTEGLARLGLLGEDAVWGRIGDGPPVSAVNSCTRWFIDKYSQCAGAKLVNRILAYPNGLLNRTFNSYLLGDQVRIFARKTAAWPPKSGDDYIEGHRRA